MFWNNFPLSLKGQYHNPKDSKLAGIKVEAWCDADLYIWSWFVGRPGTTNEKTMVSFSPLFQSIFNRFYPIVLAEPYQISVGAVVCRRGYFLADGIYPHFPIFVLPLHQAELRRKKTTRADRRVDARTLSVPLG